MAAQDSKQDARFLRRWLRRRHPHLRKNGKIILLPKQIRCYGGKLMLSLPADFQAVRHTKQQIEFVGRESGLCMTLMQIPFQRHLHTLSAIELLMAFGFYGSPDFPRRLPELTNGFLRYSPTLHAVWDAGNEKTVLHLIQVRQTVFLFLFPMIHWTLEPTAEAIIYSASVGTAQ